MTMGNKKLGYKNVALSENSQTYFGIELVDFSRFTQFCHIDRKPFAYQTFDMTIT